MYLALDNELEILPVVNKIDLPAARPEEVAEEIEEILGIDATDVIPISAKNQINIDSILESIHKLVPPPKADRSAPSKALIFDAKSAGYLGVIVMSGFTMAKLKRNQDLNVQCSQYL